MSILFDEKMLHFVVCPVSKESLVYCAKKQELIAKKAKLAYPIKDGIPILLPEEARALADDE
jgi:uncharacterized protein